MKLSPILALISCLLYADIAQADIADRDRFDLICRLRSRIVAQPHPPPGTNVGRGPDNERWSTVRLIIDMRRRLFCHSRAQCAIYGPQPLDYNSLHLIIVDVPGDVWRVERTTGRSRQEIVSGETAIVYAGLCRQAPFSGFPRRGG